MGDTGNIYNGPVKVEYSPDGENYTDVGYTTDDFNIEPEIDEGVIEAGQAVGIVGKFRRGVRSFVGFEIQEVLNLGLFQTLGGLEQSPGQGVQYSSSVGSSLYIKFTRLNYTGAAKIYTTQVFQPVPGAMTMGKNPNPYALRFEEYPTNDATTGSVTFGAFSAS